MKRRQVDLSPIRSESAGSVSAETVDQLGALCDGALVHDPYAAEVATMLLQCPGRILLTAHSKESRDHLAGAALMSFAREAPLAFVDMIGVRPEYEGLGIGSRLLRALETTALDHGASTLRVAGNPPCYGWPGIDVRYPRTVNMFDRSHYRRETVEFNLRVDLQLQIHKASRTTLPPNSVVMAKVPRSRRAWLEERLSANWKRDWVLEADLALSRHVAVPGASGVYVALEDDHCLGFCVWGVSRPINIGPAGTTPSASGKGLGSALLRACMKEQAALGMTTAVIQWAGPIGWFCREFEATTDSTYLTYSRDLT